MNLCMYVKVILYLYTYQCTHTCVHTYVDLMLIQDYIVLHLRSMKNVSVLSVQGKVFVKILSETKTTQTPGNCENNRVKVVK